MIASIFCQDLTLKVAYTHGRFRCHGYLWLCWLLRVSFREERLAAVVPKSRSWVEVAAINVSCNLSRTGITKTSVSLTLNSDCNIIICSTYQVNPSDTKGVWRTCIGWSKGETIPASAPFSPTSPERIALLVMVPRWAAKEMVAKAIPQGSWNKGFIKGDADMAMICNALWFTKKNL